MDKNELSRPSAEQTAVCRTPWLLQTTRPTAAGLCQRPDAGRRADCSLAPEPRDSKPRGIACKKIFNILFARDLCFQSSGRSMFQTQSDTDEMFSDVSASECRGRGKSGAPHVLKKLTLGLEWASPPPPPP